MLKQDLAQQNNLQILLAVWGERFIKDFLQFGLLSLLAPGNLPAITKVYPTKFVILTRLHDIDVFKQHAVHPMLASFCDVEFIAINDLIVIGNHSTTLTYAYDRAIRKTKSDMLHTYFILLNADYIMADGSFQGLMRYMQKGYSAICAGNFQVAEDGIKPFLKRHIDPINSIIKIKPRVLLKKSFKHFHPITIASIHNQSYLHNYHANRFFLRYSTNVLAGRFYLLHVLCIKPEITDYQIGSSFDYSFIPEMCPSAHIGVIDDSDDYLVIEMQPKTHELRYVSDGPYDSKKLIIGLAEWTTKQHRKNVEHIIYYHTQDLSVEAKNKIKALSDRFIDPIASGLSNYKIQPYRGHPYWIGSINAFNKVRAIIKENDIPQYFDLISLDYITKLKKLSNYLLGYPPTVYRWHYRWLEYRTTQKIIAQFLEGTESDNTICLYTNYNMPFMQYSKWLKVNLNIPHQYHLSTLISTPSLLEVIQKQIHKRCIIFSQSEDMKKTKKTLSLIKKILSPDGKILIIVPNPSLHHISIVLYSQKKFVRNILTTFINVDDYHIHELITIHNNFTLWGSFLTNFINSKFSYSRKVRLFFYALIGLSGTFVAYIRNLLTYFFTTKKGFCTNIAVTLTPTNEKTHQDECQEIN